MTKRSCSTRRSERGPRVRGPDDAATLMRVLVCDDHHDGEFVLALGYATAVVIERVGGAIRGARGRSMRYSSG